MYRGGDLAILAQAMMLMCRDYMVLMVRITLVQRRGCWTPRRRRNESWPYVLSISPFDFASPWRPSYLALSLVCDSSRYVMNWVPPACAFLPFLRVGSFVSECLFVFYHAPLHSFYLRVSSFFCTLASSFHSSRHFRFSVSLPCCRSCFFVLYSSLFFPIYHV